MELERDLSPPQVAKVLGTTPDKIIRLIRGGQLEGYDCAENPHGERPRFRVTPEALRAFRERRAVVPPTRKTRRVNRSINEGAFYS